MCNKTTMIALALLAIAATTTAQQIGKQKANLNPGMTSQTCTKSGGCTSEQTKVTMDANWRWLHKEGTSSNCYTGNSWDSTACPDGKTCASNCGPTWQACSDPA